MKAKVLLLIGLVAGGNALAQVISQNIVGYVNVTVKKGTFGLISNPLKSGDNKLQTVVSLPDADAVFYTFSGGQFKSAILAAGEWGPENPVVAPGGGFFVFAPSADLKLTLVGEVDIAGAVAGIPIAKGLNLVSSVLPKSAAVADLEYPLGDEVFFQFKNGGYTSDTVSGGESGAGGGKGITLAVAEAVFINNTGAAKTWKQPSASALLQ